MSGSLVEVHGLSRLFKLGGEEVWAVRDVDLRIEPGEFVALIGRSGSGKTTLLNLIAGLDRPTRGTVLIDGQRIDSASEKELTELRRRKLGFVFQSFGLLPLLSAQENVELPLRIAGFGHGDRRREARRALAMVGLARRAEHRPYELSGGEQQRVAIARAMATRPSLLLADEPTGELDSATATAIFTLLRDVGRSEGVTIITCTHDPLVMDLADRVEELADGRILAGGGHVLAHVRQRPSSVFRAAQGGRRGPLSSLIGGEVPQFEPEIPSREPPPGGPEEGEPEDPRRWARPDD